MAQPISTVRMELSVCELVFSEAHNPSRSIPGIVCVFVPWCGKLGRGQLYFNQLAIECCHLRYLPLLSVLLVYFYIIFVSKGSSGLDLRVRALAKQLYRAMFINCLHMVSCWKSVAVKKLKRSCSVKHTMVTQTRNEHVTE